MEISLVNAGLAAGAALAALPVILHLFMRQTPKHIIFPALRLIRERQKRSRKRLRVKNWLLLLARMALLALMALALARPTLNSEASIGDSDVPTALGLVFDTSLSMGYKERDKTRLDEAKEQAYELLKKTPSSSMVYVVDSAEPGVPTGLPPAQARKRVEGLTLRAVNHSLNGAVGQAYAGVTESDKPRHEVFVLTDLARSAWDMEHAAEGLDKAAKDKNHVQTYVVRLTPREVRDVAVVEAKPASDIVTEGEPVEIHARLRSLGPATKRIAEVWLDGDPKDKKEVEIEANGEADVRFVIPRVDAALAVHQGKVLISGAADPVKFDDERYFTFRVKPAANVLVVSDLDIDGVFVANAIDPEPAPGAPTGLRPYHVDRLLTSKFSEKTENLGKRYRCVFLNNVAKLSEADWGKLSAFVSEGGGLVIGLGSHSLAESYQETTPSQILPATLVEQKTPKEPTTFGLVTDYSHPLFSRHPKEITAALSQVPVVRYWNVKTYEGSRVLLSYADKSPALIERVFKGSKNGHVLLWTTPLSRRGISTVPDAWNEFPVANWSFPGLMEQTAAYLSGTNEESLTFEAGNEVVLPIDPTRRHTNYIVQDPDKKTSDRLSPPATSDALVIAAQSVGNWTVKASAADGTAEQLGFSLNPPVSETQFIPLETADLDKLFGGKKGYALVDHPDELVRMVNIGRVGRELFPWLMILIMIVVTIESVLANRFYRESGPKAVLKPA
jgi:hypothetical protein